MAMLFFTNLVCLWDSSRHVSSGTRKGCHHHHHRHHPTPTPTLCAFLCFFCRWQTELAMLSLLCVPSTFLVFLYVAPESAVDRHSISDIMASEPLWGGVIKMFLLVFVFLVLVSNVSINHFHDRYKLTGKRVRMRAFNVLLFNLACLVLLLCFDTSSTKHVSRAHPIAGEIHSVATWLWIGSAQFLCLLVSSLVFFRGNLTLFSFLFSTLMPVMSIVFGFLFWTTHNNPVLAVMFELFCVSTIVPPSLFLVLRFRIELLFHNYVPFTALYKQMKFVFGTYIYYL